MACAWCPIPGTRCDVCDPPPPVVPGLSPMRAAMLSGCMLDGLVGLTRAQAGDVLADLIARIAVGMPAPGAAVEWVAQRARDRLAERLEARR